MGSSIDDAGSNRQHSNWKNASHRPSGSPSKNGRRARRQAKVHAELEQAVLLILDKEPDFEKLGCNDQRRIEMISFFGAILGLTDELDEHGQVIKERQNNNNTRWANRKQLVSEHVKSGK